MAEKDTKPKTTAKPAATVKPVAKPATAAKPAATVKPAASVKPVTKPAAKTAQVNKSDAAASVAAPKSAAKPAPAPQAKKETAVAAAAAKPAKAAATTAKPAAAKSEKEKQPPKAKPEKAERKGGSGKAEAVAMTKNNKIRLIAIAAVAVVLVLALTLGIVLGLKSCKRAVDPYSNFNQLTVVSAASSHKNKTQVGYSANIVGTTDRYKPVNGVHDEGLSTKGYPKYGSTLDLTTEEKTTLIQENRKLTANGTWVDSSARTSNTYDKMDKDGYLYKKDGSKPGDGVPEQLYKHSGSVGLYGGDVADNEPAVVKTLTFRPRSYGSYYSVTGLYAPAGEVIKIEMTAADMNETGGITIHIGQALYNGQANNIWEQRGFNRMPVILNTMVVTKETATFDEATGIWTAYVGSFLGGPIYVRGASSTFSVTISGGVNYAHFILGVTTEEEYAVYSKSSAPYFDLEVWDRGVLHSGPKRAAKNFSYNDLYKAAVLWEKIALVTTSVSNQGIVFIYDPFVAAGAAVAFPGRRSVNCPEGWMAGSLNYESFVTSGSWGNMHEYHHNFQDYGVGYTGEVTNNGLNLVSYSLFTKISSARQLGNFGGAGLSGWNTYTSATWATQRVNNGEIGDTNGLAVYATLLHNLGQDVFIKARGTSGANYFNKFAELTHQDMTYFAELVQSYSNVAPSALKTTNYPLFVPVSSVYQTGRTYNYDGEVREITTMQPYVIPHGQPFTVDLNEYTTESGQYRSGSIVIGNGFEYTIKSVKADGINGTFVQTDKNVYTYTPNNELRSGKIYVTLEIKAKNSKWANYIIDDVTLVIEFQQSHETNKNILERTTYFYTADTAYTDAREAYEAGFAGYESKNDRNHSNPTQNCNTDIWYCTESSISKFPNANRELDIVKPYSIDVICGKLYFPEAGTYNIYLRGRKNCAVYYSTDGGKTYQLGTYIADDATSANWRNDKYFTLELKAESWVHFKEVLINVKINDGMAGFIGLGIGQWTVPMFTAEVKYYAQIDGARKDLAQETVEGAVKYYYTKDGNKVYVDNNSVRSETIYKDGNGQQVSAEEAANTQLVAPKSIAYATAYRQSYEFQKQFESDYFYVRNYTYSYSDVAKPGENATVTGTNVEAYGDSPFINMLYEGGLPNTTGKFFAKPGYKFPLEITIDLGHEVTANRFDLFGELANGVSYYPTNYYVLVGNSPEDITTPFGPRRENVKSNNGRDGFGIDESLTFRYAKIVIEAYSVATPQLRNVKFSYVIPGTATMYSLDNGMFTYKGNWRIAQSNANFGHVYLGKSGNEVSFEFEAKSDSSMVGILTSKKYGQNFEVYIDGKKVDTEKLYGDPNDLVLNLTKKLSQGKHKIVIKCKGEANIDSIVIYP